MPTLFTYNPKFDNTRHPTKRRDEDAEHLAAMLSKYGVMGKQIVYMNGGGKTYVPESPKLVRVFFGMWKEVPKETAIFTDGSRAFKEGSKDVIKELGFAGHLTYPSEVHAFLSPNDNGLHGPAKRQWLEKFESFTDDVEASICLLRVLSDGMLKSRDYFSRNLCLPPRRLSFEAVPRLHSPSRLQG